MQEASISQDSRRRVALGGVLVDRVSRAEAEVRLASFVSSGGNHQVVTVNTDFLRIAKGDRAFRAILNECALAVADGMPVVWLSRLLRRPIPQRVTGFDLIDSSCRLAIRSDIGVFLVGAAPGIADAAARELRRRHPGLRVAGVHSPPFAGDAAAEEARTVAAIKAAGRCVLFVAFGAPKQDMFIHDHLGELDVPVAIGVGCAFDVLAGTVRRAPRWMQRTGLEWLWRMSLEPSRLAHRYLVRDIPFLGSLVATSLRDARASHEAA
ncbi:MAG TPA: WecB/TagA/CpsF family glycosyltransferase [Candidatus Acidoferrales bacterium]|nr:WecB/TagA/CpsF family glycosyltransferase [Candidatus Acidoferrales bacterium]